MIKKGAIIAAAIVLALVTAAGVVLATRQKEDSPSVRIIEDTGDNNTPNNDELLAAQNAQIAELQTQMEHLEQEKGQAEFDLAALKASQDKMQKRIAELEKQNKYLRDRNNALSSEGQRLQNDIAAREKATADSEKAIADKEREIADKNAAIAEKDQAIADMEKAIAEKDKEIAERESQIAALNEKMEQLEQEQTVAIAALNEQLDKAEKDRDTSETAYQEALARIEEYKAQAAASQETLAEATPAETQEAKETQEPEVGPLVNELLLGQSRNTLAIKAGETDIDLAAAIAIMPHWFLLADGGAIGVPNNLVDKEFPGYENDNALIYSIMLGTGFNWRIDKLKGQPNFYISTMLGPSWFRYHLRNTGKRGVKNYLLWRSSVGFDLTLYKKLQLITDLSVDWMKDFDLTPHLTVGLQWNFSDTWSAFGGK